MSIPKSITFCAALAAMALVSNAADPALETFNPKVNAWAEGAVMSVSAENGTFTIRGAKRAYATDYAKMVREIHDKTAKMSNDDRIKKDAEIRANWATTLEKARLETPSKDSDFTFHLPSKDSHLTFFDESIHYNRGNSTPLPPASLTAAQSSAMITLSDLKVGEFISVGYDNGVLSNDAYIVMKGNKLSQADTAKQDTRLAREQK